MLFLAAKGTRGEIMADLYLITGPAGVGKSTISKMLAGSLEKSVLIEGDDIYHLVVGGYVSPWKDGNHLPLFWQNCEGLIENGLKSGYDVVFNYIISKKDLQRLCKHFKNFSIKFVALIADEKTIVERDKLRPEDCQMGERVLVLLKSTLAQNFDEKFILDTSKQSKEQTLKTILSNNRFLV